MRTNLVLDDTVARKAKALAAEQGIPFGKLVTRALRDYIVQARKTSRLSDTLKHISHTGRGRQSLALDVLNAIRDDGR